ncbi:ferrous iron transport protein A [bacterium]|nr:ferrous iron transport protein A [bacterium]
MPTQTDAPLFIDQLAVEAEFEITRVHGGRRANQRLAELGLPIGARARIIERHPLIVRVGETSLALGRGLAGKVEVRLLSGESEGKHQWCGRRHHGFHRKH